MIKHVARALVIALVAGTAVGGTAATSAASGAVQSIAGTAQLFDIACPSATTCVAVGFAGDVNSGSNEGVVVPITNGTPGTPHVVSGTDELLSVACSSATSCLAIGGGDEGVLVPITNGIPGSAQVVPSAADLNAVACYGNNCVAVGVPNYAADGSLVLPITNGTPGTPQIASGADLTGVACPGPSTCLAVGNAGSNGVAVPITNGTPGSAKTMSGTSDFTLASVACTSTTSCDAVGYQYTKVGPNTGVVVPVSKNVPGTAHVVANMPLLDVACATATTCLAVGTNGTADVPITNGTPGTSEGPTGGSNWLEGVSCANASTCWAVGGTASEGALVRLTVPGGGGPAYVALGDSYSSGEGNKPFMQPNTGCDRSVSKAWPELVASMFGVKLDLLACSGATTAALTHTFDSQKPQLAALGSSTPKLVTVTMAGDDLGFSYVIASCFSQIITANCTAALAGLEGSLAGGFGKHMTAVYKEIKAAAPGAHILVVGYPQLIPANPVRAFLHCPELGGPGVVELMHLVDEQLNSVLTRAAAAAGVDYVSTLNVLKGHELCTGDSWVNSIWPSKQSGHPNAQGQAMMAGAVEDYVALHHWLS